MTTPMRALVVVPSYNEAARLDVAALEGYLKASQDVGLLLVNDGSTDSTLKVLRDLEKSWPDRIEVIDQQPNQGKAEAVRVGMRRAWERGTAYAGYFDADFATPLEEIAQFVQVLESNPAVDFVVGARLLLLGRDIQRKASRHYLGRVFATVASLVLDLPVYDTQCGAKLFRSTEIVRSLFEQPFGSRWIFDVEIMARFLALGGSRDAMYEHPLRRWADVGESKVKPTDFLRAVAEMGAIYRKYPWRGDRRLLLRIFSSPLVRYVGAGGVGTIAHYATLVTAVTLLGVDPAVATGLGATIGAMINYFLNYHLTFASKASHRTTLPKFLVVAALSAAFNTWGMAVAVRQYHIHWLIAQLACTAGVLALGYVLNKAWTFRSADQ